MQLSSLFAFNCARLRAAFIASMVFSVIEIFQVPDFFFHATFLPAGGNIVAQKIDFL